MLTFKIVIRSAAIFAIMGAGASFAQGLPGGASSLNEKHGDWTVACATRESAVHCAMSQTQVRGESRQRVLAVEMTASASGDSTGTLVMPFGLALDQGVVLSIDESEFLPPLRFSTCVRAGCLVPLTFDQDAVAAMRVGTALKVKVTASDSDQEVNFSISLAGFSSALARAAELGTAP